MKTEKKKTLRGSALFTVVAVMAILILFLTGTLALATASNSRAHKSYAVSQASYTARAAIRAFKEGMTQDADLAATVGALGESGGKAVLPIKIEMSDTTMGRLGHWDTSDPNVWVNDEVILESVPDKVDWVYDVNKKEWVSWNIVKLTSTCRVGQEEETVIAYISKHGVPGETQQSNNEVKGLQEAGGNNYRNGADIYGGLGIGLANDHPSSYGGKNSFKTHTTLTFINGDFDYSTSSVAFNVDDNDSGTKPVSATVIMGNFSSSNDKAFNINYTMKNHFTQKDIPYLYVDGLFYSREDTTVNFTSGNDSPFNIYAGTMYYSDIFKATADLYLMDEPYTSDVPDSAKEYYSTGYKLMADGFPQLRVPASMQDKYPSGWPDGQYWPNPATEEDKTIAMQDPANIIEAGLKVEKGHSIIGDYSGSGKEKGPSDKTLKKWAASTFTRTDDSKIDSFGGTIFCNGDLELGRVDIYGDVRVKGKCTIRGGDTIIHGDLVVENAYDATGASGLFFENGASETCVRGRIYTSQGTVQDTSKLKDGYSLKTGIYPDYKMYENKELPNVDIVESAYEINSDGKYVYAGETYDSKPYIQCKPLTDDASGITIGSTNPEIITTSENTIFKAFPDGRILDDDGNFEVTNQKKVYYNKAGEECTESEATGEYYADASGNRVSRADAFVVSFSGEGTVDVNTYPKGSAYPEDMTREKIYGTSDGKNAAPATKIITTLADARKALGMDNNGYFDEKIYIREKPTSKIGGTYTGAVSDDIVITRPNDNYEWYILDNLNLSNGKKIIIKDNPSAIKPSSDNIKYQGGIIRFFIIGDVQVGNSVIGPEKIIDGTIKDITYKDDFGIEYYTGGPYRDYSDASDPKHEVGQDTEGTLRLNNNCLIVGSIKAPYLDIGFEQGEGSLAFSYKNENGSTVTNYKPCIIGNALVRKVTDAGNGINLAYTKSGTSAASDNGDETAVDPSGTKWKFQYYTR